MELNCTLGGVLGPVSLSDSDDPLQTPARKGWFPVGTEGSVGMELMIESTGVVAKGALEKFGRLQAQQFHETPGIWAKYTVLYMSVYLV